MADCLSILPIGLPSISFIKILQLIIVCCIFGIDVHTKNYSQTNNGSTLLNEVIDNISNNIPNLNVTINAESIFTEYISTGTVFAYFIIIFVSFASGLFGSSISKIPNIAFCIIGSILFAISGSFLLSEFLNNNFESIKQIEFEKSLQNIRNYSLVRASLCILEAVLLLLDPISSFIPCF